MLGLLKSLTHSTLFQGQVAGLPGLLSRASVGFAKELRVAVTRPMSLGQADHGAAELQRLGACVGIVLRL